MTVTELTLEYNDIENVYYHNVGSPFPQQKRGPCSGLQRVKRVRGMQKKKGFDTAKTVKAH